MYGTLQTPTAEKSLWLNENYEDICKQAAESIASADMFCLHIGAGFSADSGLAVYKDIADIPAYHKMNLDYSELCCPEWIEDDPAVFFGFMGKCFNDYRSTVPHEGYFIIKQWKDRFFTPKTLNNEENELFKEEFGKTVRARSEGIHENAVPTENPFFIYSSNVDSHPLTAGFQQNELHEIHGTMEKWQCSVNCSKKVWKAPAGHKFKVDKDTMLAEDISILAEGEPVGGFQRNYPTCLDCGGLARPNILMFGDFFWEDDTHNYDLYRSWCDIVREFLAEGKKLVILEIGAGIRIPSVRLRSESFLRCNGTTLIRVNPDYCEVNNHNYSQPGNTISIQSKGLAAIKTIDKYLQEDLKVSASVSSSTIKN